LPSGGTPPVAVSPPPKPPVADMRASREVQAWIARLEAERRTVGKRNKYLAACLAGGVVLLLAILWGVYRGTVGGYAVLSDVEIRQHPISEGRAEISFQVLKPGKVHYRRSSGRLETELVDSFRSAGPVQRAWTWVYSPGSEIEVTLWYRGGPLLRSREERFATSGRADVLILIDTTGSMSRSIAELKDKCVDFSRQLEKQALAHRIGLIGFGDAEEGPWLDKHDFTSDVVRYQQSVAALERFDGGDLPESALDAVEEGLAMPLDDGSIRRFYLVTDAPYHEPSRSGATAAELAERLRASRVLLSVFSRPQYEEDYRKLLGETGRFLEIENFGKALGEGRVLED